MDAEKWLILLNVDNGVSSSFVSSTPSTGPTSLGWIGGIPQMGYTMQLIFSLFSILIVHILSILFKQLYRYYGPGATAWAAGSPIPIPNEAVKTSLPTHPNHPTMQVDKVIPCFKFHFMLILLYCSIS